MTHPDPSFSASGFIPSGFFVLRTPLLSFDELLALTKGLEAATISLEDPSGLAAACSSDRARMEARLRVLAERPEVREAIYLASPSLDKSLEAWLREPATSGGTKVARALFRYLIRMTARPTPFGLFAGLSVGRIDEVTLFHLAPRARAHKHARLDVGFLAALSKALSQHPHLSSHLSLQPSMLLRRAGNSFRSMARRRSARLDGTSFVWHCITVAATPRLEVALSRASTGCGVRLPELVAMLIAEEPTLSQEMACAYVAELISQQILVTSLVPEVTGHNPIEGVLSQLRPYAAMRGVVELLNASSRTLATLEAEGIGSTPSAWRSVASNLAGLPSRVELEGLSVTSTTGIHSISEDDKYAKVLSRIARADTGLYQILARGLEARAAQAQSAHVVQVDLFKESPAATLGREPVDELLRGVELLRSITAHGDPLADFAAAFVARYGDEEVPILEALDEEQGIPFPASDANALHEPLLEGLDFPEINRPDLFDDRAELLLELLHEVLRTGARSIELLPADIAQLAAVQPRPLSDAFAILASIAAQSEEALSAGRFRIHLARVLGPSGASLLGRFCHGDPDLAAHVRAHLRAEEALRPDAILAEVVYLPDGREGTVVCRPPLRAYEIPVGTASSMPSEHRIELTDLWLSVVDGRLTLRSARLGREILPRLTSAHNYEAPHHLAVYRFLCTLQYCDSVGPLAFSWGPLKRAPFLPRVTSGRLVLSLARWRINRDHLTRFSQLNGAARYAAVQKLRQDLELPRFIELTEHDHHLLLDFDNALAVDEFVELCKGREAAVLTEAFPPPDEVVARGPEGSYMHELIVPFTRRDARPAPRVTPRAPLSIPRRLPPGSSWLYYKFYTTPAVADELLREVVRPIVQRARTSGDADSWFFIRYADPDFHLRVRFHGVHDASLQRIDDDFKAKARSAFDRGSIIRIQLDTYEREVTRYGGPDGIGFAERIFHADSEAVLGLIEHCNDNTRWLLALRGIDQLLEDFGFSLDEKYSIVAGAHENLARRLRANGMLRHLIAKRFRSERSAIETILARSADSVNPLAPALTLFARRSEALRPIVVEIQALESAGRLTHSIIVQAQSYIHMFANRLFRSSPLEQELVSYGFLARIYRSRLLRDEAK